MSPSAIAMLYGIVGSVLFNLSKGLQRHGIGALAFFIPKRRQRREDAKRPGSAKNIALYATGFILNNSLGLFAILANRYAPSSYYTSMFGTGLIALMLYSGFILKEPLRLLQYAGAIVLTLGTLILGYDGILRPKMTMAGISFPAAGIALTASFLVGGFLIFYARGKRSLAVLGVVCGLLTGFAAGLDPILKGIGQNLGGDGRYLPRLPLGWVIFLASFLFATLSFVASQWSFGRHVRASVLIPSQSFAYIIYPILFQAVALPGFTLTRFTAAGLFVTILGIVIMQTTIKRK
jgi:drug/metabolite transporter (DMT)-like permease